MTPDTLPGYDDWKTETPEDEPLNAQERRRLARAMWEEEHADYLLEELRERVQERDEDEND